MINHTPEQLALRERYLLAFLAVTPPLYANSPDQKLTMELLIEAAELLPARLRAEQEELRIEDD